MSTDRTEAIRKRVEKYYKERADVGVHFTIYMIVNMVLWGIWAFTRNMTGDSVFPWPLFISMGWGAGMAGHVLEMMWKAPSRYAALERSVQNQMTHLYGPEWNIEVDEPEYQRMFKAAEKVVKDRQEFITHAVIYVIINLMFWFIFAFTGAEFPFPLLIMAFWGIGLGAHAANVYFNSERQQIAREEAIQREVERLAAEMQVVKKKKRDSARLEMSDGGELMDIVEDDWEAQDRRGGKSR